MHKKIIVSLVLILIIVLTLFLYGNYKFNQGIEVNKEEVNRYLTYSAINCYPIILNYYGNEIYLAGIHCFENKSWFENA